MASLAHHFGGDDLFSSHQLTMDSCMDLSSSAQPSGDHGEASWDPALVDFAVSDNATETALSRSSTPTVARSFNPLNLDQATRGTTFSPPQAYALGYSSDLAESNNHAFIDKDWSVGEENNGICNTADIDLFSMSAASACVPLDISYFSPRGTEANMFPYDPNLDTFPSNPASGATSTERFISPHKHPFSNSGPNGNGDVHKPRQLTSKYDKFSGSHLMPLHGRHFQRSNLQPSSTASLSRHEHEGHEMHGYEDGQEEILCEYPPCSRSLPGNGFRRSYNCKDHMARCHGWVKPNVPAQKNKKKRSAKPYGGDARSNNKMDTMRQQLEQLEGQWVKSKATLENLALDLAPDEELFRDKLQQLEAEMQTLKSIQVQWAKVAGKIPRSMAISGELVLAV